MIPAAQRVLALTAAAAAALAARADGPASPPPPRAEVAPADTSSPRVRATHRVEIIAPGERIETVLDRVRGPHGGAPTEVGARPALPVREPDVVRDGGRRPESAPGGAAQGQQGGQEGARSEGMSGGEGEGGRPGGMTGGGGEGGRPEGMSGGGSGGDHEGRPHSDGTSGRH